MDLFDHHHKTQLDRQAPLAARMRPRTLDEFVGQDAIIGPGKLLRRAIAADQLTSLIFYGPPGTGKTTLAQIIANTTRAHFIALNAVLAGVKDIREAISEAQTRHGQYSQRTLLFIDEVHRFNKAQQDALLPRVENGTITLIGATTENPYFEVNKALVSRSRLFQLQSLTPRDLHRILDQALSDPDRGYGDRPVHLADDARDHLVNVTNGDARALLNALELAIVTTPADDSGTITIPLSVAEDSIQRRAVLYDKEGDAHFDTISAFIKSIRGSDPDAALYWLARMIYSGEDPRFIFRRLLIFASEDVGLADPQAIALVTACATSFDRIGLPEGQYPLAQATLYLANAPKSNSVLGYFEALKAVEQERNGEVPNALKDSSRDKHSFGHGANYKYPHAYRDHWVAQQYLPSGLQGQAFYQPSNQGYEATIALQVSRRREAQLAALNDQSDWPEVLSFSPLDRQSDRWLQRALNQAGDRLGNLRDQLFERAQLQRHSRVLVLNAGSGLLLWEALRQTPEGGVVAWVRSESERAALQAIAQDLPELLRPEISVGAELVPELITGGNPDDRFERIIGRNVLWGSDRPGARLQQIAALLTPKSKLVLAENLPRKSQRLYAWIDRAELANLGALGDRWIAAEEAQYTNDPALGWGVTELQAGLDLTGRAGAIEVEATQLPLQITNSLIARWFNIGADSYQTRLSQHLRAEEIRVIQQVFVKQLLGKSVEIGGAIAWIISPGG